MGTRGSPASALRFGGGALALMIAAALGIGQPPAAPAPAADLASWRAAVERLRSLVENDPALALREAGRLAGTPPPDGAAAGRVAALNVRARAELYLGDAGSAAELARQARLEAERAGDRAGQVEANLVLTPASIFMGRIEDSYDATTRALTLAEGVDRPELLAEAMFATCGMYQRRGQLEELVTTAMQAVEIARRSEVPMALVHAHRALGVAYTHTGHPAEAREHFIQMLEAARSAGATLKEADALLGIAGNLAGLGQLEDAEARVREAIALYRRVGTPFSQAVGLYTLADILRRQGRTEEALSTLNDIAALYEGSPNRLGLWWTLRARSEVHRALRQPDAAERDLRRAYAIAQETGVPFYRSESAKLLAAVAADRGEIRRAYAYLVEASETAAQVAREGASARIMELTRRYEAESRRRQLDDLARREREQAMRLRQQELQQRWLWTVLVLGALLLAGTVFFLVRLRRSHALLEIANAELERRVADRTAELQATNRELEAFAYSVSHDLRAPVRQVDAFAGLLAGRGTGGLDPQAREYLDGIARSARRMGALIEDLLAFSRTARADLTRAPVDLGALTRDVIRELSTEAASRDIVWQVGPLPVVLATRPLLRIVLVNLLSNAVKYTRLRARAHVEIGAVMGEREVIVFVRDDGVGFDPRYAAKLFGVFQRLHGPEEFEGSGIGLATVRRIVSRHGGRTWAEGRVGEGATFYFSLPVPVAEPAPSGEAGGQAAGPLDAAEDAVPAEVSRP